VKLFLHFLKFHPILGAKLSASHDKEIPPMSPIEHTSSVSSALPHTAATAPAPHRNVAMWLFFVAAMVFIMVVIGGLTRLTESGLSIVEWRPFTGIIPPMNEADWMALYQQYSQYPEFQKINAWMSVEDFKSIFWWLCCRDQCRTYL
jgi:cytochrome c oxidase assembly protein subunit 15